MDHWRHNNINEHPRRRRVVPHHRASQARKGQNNCTPLQLGVSNLQSRTPRGQNLLCCLRCLSPQPLQQGGGAQTQRGPTQTFRTRVRHPAVAVAVVDCWRWGASLEGYIPCIDFDALPAVQGTGHPVALGRVRYHIRWYSARPAHLLQPGRLNQLQDLSNGLHY